MMCEAKWGVAKKGGRRIKDKSACRLPMKGHREGSKEQLHHFKKELVPRKPFFGTNGNVRGLRVAFGYCLWNLCFKRPFNASCFKGGVIIIKFAKIVIINGKCYI
jgi:hypothetical protein